MDLGVTMGISLRFKAARPYLLRQAGGKLERGWIKDLFFRLDFEDIVRIRLQARVKGTPQPYPRRCGSCRPH